MGPRVLSKAQNLDFNRDPLINDERFKFLLIKDTVNFSGFNIFKTILNSYCQSDVKVGILSVDGLKENLSKGIKTPSNLFIWDEFQNYSEWNQQLLSEKYFKVFSEKEDILCIYSLTSLIIQEGSEKIYKFLHKLLAKNTKLQILALLHEDVHSTEEVRQFESLASSVIDTSFKQNSNRFLMSMSTRNKSYGPVVYDFEICFSNFTFASINVESKTKAKPSAKKADPTANLTFNLNLNEDEKKAREQLQMPYIKTEIPESLTTQDLEDFYEEEDPDDDLGYLEAV